MGPGTQHGDTLPRPQPGLSALASKGRANRQYANVVIENASMFWFQRHQCYSPSEFSHNATSSSSLASFRLVNRPRQSRMSYVSDRTAKAHPTLCENHQPDSSSSSSSSPSSSSSSRPCSSWLLQIAST
ncbi:hypothetical protein ACLKA6_014955 [Drosophila palustris]